jgi:hypothetical protein
MPTDQHVRSQAASITQPEPHWELLFIVFQVNQVAVFRDHNAMTTPQQQM